MGLSNIQWCDYTFNAWMGCRKVAPECVNCYITSTPPFRFRKLTHGPARVRTAESTWKQPLAWNRKAEGAADRPRVFCLSLGDWLDDEGVPIEWLADLLKLIHDTPNLDWLLLTKRPQNWHRRMEAVRDWCIKDAGESDFDLHLFVHNWFARCDIAPPANVWIGVSAGADQAAALNIPARVHFLSCEPMLRPLDAEHASDFDWIIFGGESGKKARRCSTQWIRDGVAYCNAFGVAPFVKQMGSNCTDPTGEPLRLKDSHGGDMTEWCEDLRVREFPTVK